MRLEVKVTLEPGKSPLSAGQCETAHFLLTFSALSLTGCCNPILYVRHSIRSGHCYTNSRVDSTLVAELSRNTIIKLQGPDTASRSRITRQNPIILVWRHARLRVWEKDGGRVRVCAVAWARSLQHHPVSRRNTTHTFCTSVHGTLSPG